MVENTFVGCAIDILCCTFSVCKVIWGSKGDITFCTNSRRCFITSRKTALGSIHANNLPSCNYLIVCIVLSSYIIVVRQLNLIVVEVEMCRVFIRDISCYRRSNDSSTRGSIAAPIPGTVLYIYCQCTKFASLIILCLLCCLIARKCLCIVCINIHHRWILHSFVAAV